MAAQNKTPQNLSPDLKQIYDRVMNTPSKKEPGNNKSTQPPQQPQSGGSPMPSVSQQQPQQPQQPTQTQPQQNTQTPQAQTPAQSNSAPSAPPPQPAAPAPANTPQPAQQPPNNQPQGGDQSFLTSTPPRPPGGVGIQSFSMDGNKENKKSDSSKGGKKLTFSKPVIIGLIGVFFVAWTFFWVVFFFRPF